MDMYEYGKALAGLWTLGGQAFLSAQESTAKAFAEGVKAAAGATLPGTTAPLVPPMPTIPGLSEESAALTCATQSVMELWSAATAMAGTIATRLPKTVTGAGKSGDGLDSILATTFQRVVDPRAWLVGSGEIDEMLSRMAEGPRFADLWDVERRYVHVFQAWMAMRRSSLEHNAITIEAWLRAARTFAEQLDTAETKDPKALFDRWVETANRTLIETQRSEPYLRTQAALIRASTELKEAQCDLAEYYGERFGFPTRRELDDVHRTVTELRRELRALQRQVKAGGTTGS